MFRVKKAALQSALALAGNIVEKSSTIPILRNVLIDRGDDLTLTTRLSSLDVEASTPFEAISIDMDFQPFTVPASMLFDIVRKLPGDADVSIERAAGVRLDSIVLKSGRSKFSLQVLPASDFPQMVMKDPAGRLT